MYERGAITDDTSCLFDKPYCAAPRNVAVSESGGRTMSLILEENVSLIPAVSFLPEKTLHCTNLDALLQVLTSSKASNKKYGVNWLFYLI